MHVTEHDKKNKARLDPEHLIILNRHYDPRQKKIDNCFDTQSEFWRNAYQRSDTLGIIYRKRLAVALSWVNDLVLPKSASVLEIGCGPGFASIELAKRGFKVEAIDSVSKMVELSKLHAKQRGVGNDIRTSIGDVHKLTYKNNAFSLVIAIGVVSLLHSLKTALAEISRVLKPGGYLILSFDNKYSMDKWIDLPLLVRGKIKEELAKIGLKFPPHYRGTPPYSYTLNEFKGYLFETKFRIIENTKIGFKPFTFLGHNIFSDFNMVKVHNKLQQYTEKNYPFVSSSVWQCMILAKKENNNQ